MSIFDKAFCLSVTFSRFGIDRKVPTSAVTVDANKKRIKVTKAILESKTLEEIRTFDGKVATYLRNRTVPASTMLRDGVYLIAVEAVDDVDEALIQFGKDRSVLVSKFLTEYTALIEQSKKDLNGLFNEADYPSAAAMESKFGIDVKYLTFGVPEALADVAPEIFKREKSAAQQRIRDQVEEIVLLMRASFKQLVDHMIDRLTPGEDGKPKVFHDSMVKNFGQYLETFKSRNIADDVELSSLVTQAQAIMAGVDTKVLKSQKDVREYGAKSMTTIKASLDTLVTDKGRTISFEEE